MHKVFTYWIDVGKPKPVYIENNFEWNKQFFDETFFITTDMYYNFILKEALKDYRILSMFKKPNCHNQLDVVRIWLMWKNPTWIYIDTDVRVLKNFEIKKDKPAFARRKKICDTFIIVGNGCGEFFNMMLDTMYQKHPDYCHPHNVPKDWDNVIERDYFTHDKVCR